MINIQYDELINTIKILLSIFIFGCLSYLYNKYIQIKHLNSLLENQNMFIITNEFCKCNTFKFYGYNLFTIPCYLCQVKRVINFENEAQVYDNLFNNITNKVKFIIHTNGGETDLPNFITYILKQHKVNVESYIPRIALSAGSFIALSSNTIYMNWFSSMGPIDTQVTHNYNFSNDEEMDETFAAKHIMNIKNQENALTKLRAMESSSYHSDDKFIISKIFNSSKSKKIIKNFLETPHSHSIRYGPKDLQQFGLNVKIGIPNHIIEIFNLFIKLSN